MFVFNHEKWGREVEELVAEVLDQETTIAQRPTDKRPAKHFDLHVLSSPRFRPASRPRRSRSRRKSRSSTSAHRATPRERRVGSVTDSAKRLRLVTLVKKTYYPLSTVVAEVRQRMKTHDEVTGGDLMKQYPKSADRAPHPRCAQAPVDRQAQVSQENRQLILSAFGSLRQKTTRAGADREFGAERDH